jgi:hypothetical protein
MLADVRGMFNDAADGLHAAVSRLALRVEVRPGGVGCIRATAGQDVTIEIHRPLRPSSEVSLAFPTEERLKEFRGHVAACEVIALGGKYGITYRAVVVLATPHGIEWAGIAQMGTSCL